ncbi:MAG: FadR family transcriptional regulator [Eubacterium sp.]|nr:FadR family transcriptional regulator [Eubacterium sp.]
MEKSYEKVVQHVKNEILSGSLHPGDKLATERVLAEQLTVSRNSVREGLRILENIGVITSQQGSGNYISLNFDETMSEVLSFMYFLKGMDERQVTEFRRFIEREAMLLAVKRADREQKQRLMIHLDGLEKAITEQDRVLHDKGIHRVLVEASRNDFLITNYQALTNLMDRYISSMRTRIISGMQSRNKLEYAHRMLVEGVVESNLEKGLAGLRDHFGYIEQYKDLF